MVIYDGPVSFQTARKDNTDKLYLSLIRRGLTGLLIILVPKKPVLNKGLYKIAERNRLLTC